MCEVNKDNPNRKELEHCQEYCDGNIAIYYCPQCWANYCQECYDKEHKLKRRKEDHDKILTPRKMCSQHKLTLEYQNKVKNCFMCCMCVREMPPREFAGNSVEPIDGIASVMKGKLEERITELGLLSDTICKKMEICSMNISTAIEDARNEVKRFFGSLSLLLVKHEESFQHQLTNLLEITQSKPVLKEMRQTLSMVEKLVSQGKALLAEDNLVVANGFHSIAKEMDGFLARNKMKDLVSPTLRVSVNVHRDVLEMVKHPGYISSTFDDLLEDHETCENNDDTYSLIPEYSRNSSPLFYHDDENSASQSLSSTVVDQSGLNDADEDVCGCSQDEDDKENDTTYIKREETLAKGSEERLTATNKTENDSDFVNDKKKHFKRKLSQSNCVTPFNRKTRRNEVSKELSRCDEILTEIWACDDSYPFARPVDPKKVPRYYEVIKTPMDLGKIKSKLESVSYDSVYGFVDDMKLMFQNCYQFNLPKSTTFESGVNLEKQFVTLLQQQFPSIYYESPRETIEF